jgi:hypothetical protein
MCEIDIREYMAELSDLSDDELSDYVRRLCPNCMYIFLGFVINHQDRFSEKNITVSLIKHAWMFRDFYETYLIEKNK